MPKKFGNDANREKMESMWTEVRSIPLDKILDTLYPGAKKVRDSVGSKAASYAKESWKYTLSQGDHLKIAGDAWHFFERARGGRGAIDFYAELNNIEPADAIEELKRDYRPDLLDPNYVRTAKPRPKTPPAPKGPEIPEVPDEPKEPFKLPPVSRLHMVAAIGYLEGRGLKPEMVKAMMDARLVYAAVVWKEKKGKRGNPAPDTKEYMKFLNIVQVVTSFRTGEVIGVSNRSIKGNSKINEGDKQCGAFQINPYGPETKRVVQTESPIEAMSYYQIHQPGPDTCIVGQSGTSIPMWFVYEAGKKGCVIESALNNDIPGRKASGKVMKFCQEHGIEFRSVVPPNGEIELELENNDVNRGLIGSLIRTAEKNDLSLTCEPLKIEGRPEEEPLAYKVRTENTRETCLEIYRVDKAEADRVRDANRDLSYEWRKENPGEAMPKERQTARPMFKVQYSCTDWNDEVCGLKDMQFDRENPVRNYPEEFTRELMAPGPNHSEPSLKHEGAATAEPKPEAGENSPSVEV